MYRFVKSCIVFLIVFHGVFFFSSFSRSSDDLRIVCLSPAATEILFDLGADKWLAGITNECDYPPATKGIPKVGTFSNPSVEYILEKNPDIVITDGLEQQIMAYNLRKFGIKTLTIFPSDFEGLFDAYIKIGDICGLKREALEKVRLMKNDIGRVLKKVKHLKKKPQVFVEIWSKPLITAAKGSHIDEVLRLAGGINIAYNCPRPYSRVSPELVIISNPDIIVLAYKDESNIGLREGWQNINAVKKGFVCNDINPDFLVRAGPRLIEGLEKLRKLIEKWDMQN
ncbi:MAG: ABC transporter substrate-binding protein [Candidatus Aureabacteria bacterium]|nr:ABC transporter substrate-binding protein [Candidatus Auribacterota bacterium]